MPEPATDLITTLGFQPGDSVFVETTPAWYTEFVDENSVELEPSLPATHAHMFFADKSELAEFLNENNLNKIAKSLWISWPKPDSGLPTNLTKIDIKEALAPRKWVDSHAVTIDDVWLGLQFTRKK